MPFFIKGEIIFKALLPSGHCDDIISNNGLDIGTLLCERMIHFTRPKLVELN